MGLPMADRSGLKLHLGCGTRTPAGWQNVDAALGARLAKIRPLRPLLRATGADLCMACSCSRLQRAPGCHTHVHERVDMCMRMAGHLATEVP